MRCLLTSARAVVPFAAAALLVGACGVDVEAPETTETVTETATLTPPAENGSTPTVTVTASPLPEEEPSEDEAPFPANRQPDTADPTEGARLSPVDLRFGVHEGYDRIVLDLEGQGLPGWFGEYVDTPTEQGSGFEVAMAGSAYLQIAVTGVRYPTEEGAQEYDGPESLRPDGAGVVEEVRMGGIFEGHQQVFVGLSSNEPFRIFRLEDPARVVIDVQHP